MSEQKQTIYSFVLPVFNEEETLPELHSRMTNLLDQLDASSEVVLVDDGSSDKSSELCQEICQKDKRFKLISLSRNFGHQIAITAGLDRTIGKAIVVMDADLQDPPEVVLQMVEKWKLGYDIVYGKRLKRESENLFKRVTASMFYRLFARLTDIRTPLDVGDFRLVSRPALDAFLSLRERNRFVRGMFSWVGFKQTGVDYERKGRFAGETKYSMRKMLRLASDAIISFSSLPMKISLSAGFLLACISLVSGILMLTARISDIYTTNGWILLFVAICFLSGLQLMIMGILGEYIGRIYDEVKQRPLYLIKAQYNFDTK